MIMFHSHEIANNSLSSFSRDSQDQSVCHDIHNESSCESLLTVLDDKNKIIATLQKQLQNQKVQLEYYLSRELSTTRISKLSTTCCPEVLEENMPVNLAMTNYNRKMGIKSHTVSLYERMNYIDDRLSSSMEDQAFILRKIVNKLCELMKHTNGNAEFKFQFGNFITDPFHIELFNKLLNSTVKLRKNLDAFRICCNRLMIIEDERNAIVDQIYTLPADQRLNCNYLLSIQMEKIQLENELRQIIKDQRKDQERIKNLNVIEERLSNLQFQLNSVMFKNDDGYRISKMLQQVNSEARILLDLTKQQRKKFEIKLARLKEKNLSLERILTYLKLALETKELAPLELFECGITTPEEFKIYECIKKEIDNSRCKFRCKLFDDLYTKQREIGLLKNKLSQIMLEKNELKVVNTQLERNLSDIKFNQELDLSSVKEERDMYKKQVDDLEAIRAAYAQLVSKQPTTTKLEREYLEQIKDRDEHICGLEKINRDLTQELKALKNTINRQNREIKQQAKNIEEIKQPSRNVNESEDKNLRYVYKNTNSDVYSSFKDIRDLAEHHDTISYVELYQQEIYVQEKLINWIEDGRGRGSECSKPPTFISRRLHTNSDNNCKDSNDIRGSKRSVTCFKVYSSKRGQAVDVMEAVVTTSLEADLQGNVKNSNSSAFCLEINCNPKENPKGKDRAHSDMDDFELMKDCSEESIPRVCHSRKKFRGTCFQQRFPVIDDQLEY